MRARTVVGVLGLSLAAAVGSSQAGSDSSCAVAWSPEVAPCAFEVVEFAEPLVVRTVQGTLVSEGGLPWPEGSDVAIELVEQRDHGVRYLAHADRTSGKFAVTGAVPGKYCFRVGVRPGGWSCVQGRIVVKGTGAAKAGVELTVPIGK